MSEEYTEQESGEELIEEDSSDELLEEYEDEDEEIVEAALLDGVDIDDEEDFGNWLAENYGELDEEDEEEEDEDEEGEDDEGDEDPEGDPEDEDELGEKMTGAQRRKKAKAQYKKDKKDKGKMKRRAKLAKISAKKRKGKKVKKRTKLAADFDHDIDEDFDDLDEFKKRSAADRKKARIKKAKWLKTAGGKKSMKDAKKRRAKIASGAIKVDKAKSLAMKKARKAYNSFVPSTKNQMLKNIYDEVNGMLKSDLADKYEQIMASTSLEEIEEDVVEPVRTQAISPQEIAPINVDDDIEALTKDEEGLSAEFKKKATTIFEAAVHAKVVDEVNTRMEDQQKETEASKEEFQQELTEKVDGYLTYVVEEWMSDNELAIERGIRSELVEDFMSGLKTLFTEHYIDIPEEKVDMVDDLFTKVEDLETSLDEEINRGVELQKELAQFKKGDAVKQATKDLADSDSEKIEKLAEGIEFENTEQYIEKLNVLKESYFPKSDAVTSEITETDETIEVHDEKTQQKLDESMKHYTSAIRRYNS